MLVSLATNLAKPTTPGSEQFSKLLRAGGSGFWPGFDQAGCLVLAWLGRFWVRFWPGCQAYDGFEPKWLILVKFGYFASGKNARMRLGCRVLAKNEAKPHRSPELLKAP